jgi:ADP-heptose:LPS heptosyltransferase
MIKERGSALLHYLDRAGGIPTIVLLGHLRRKRQIPQSIQTIGLLKTGAIGDTVLMSAVIADLRHTFPSAAITLFASEGNFEMADMLNGLDRVIKMPMRNLIAGIAAARGPAVDVMLDFGQWSRAEALIALFSRASYTVGFKTPGQYRHYIYDRVVDHSSDIHELENYRRIVRALGAETRSLPFLRVPEKSGTSLRDYVVFHLWPGGRRKKLKQWPLERWVRLIEEFAGQGMGVVLTGAPSDIAANDRLLSTLPSRVRHFVRNVAGTNLKETTLTLADARLVVSVDTGVMHIAAALGVPLVALHGPTSAKRWGPISERAVAIDSPLPGCGYISLGWEHRFQPPACMECISYEAVRDACTTMLLKWPSAERSELLRSSSMRVLKQTS